VILLVLAAIFILSSQDQAEPQLALPDLKLIASMHINPFYGRPDYRYNLFEYVLKNGYWNSSELSSHPSYDVYEFGVFTGGSVAEIILGLNRFDLYHRIHRIWGCDSFLGLPDEDAAVDSALEKDGKSLAYVKGGYNVQDMLGSARNPNVTKSAEVIATIIYNYTTQYEYKLEMIAGFYNDSLSKEVILKKHMKPALFVDVDCDQYVGTIQLFDFLIQNNLIIPFITIISYDDWCGILSWKNFTVGEPRAHVDIAKKYKISFKLITTSEHPAFIVTSIGNEVDFGADNDSPICNNQFGKPKPKPKNLTQKIK